MSGNELCVGAVDIRRLRGVSSSGVAVISIQPTSRCDEKSFPKTIGVPLSRFRREVRSISERGVICILYRAKSEDQSYIRGLDSTKCRTIGVRNKCHTCLELSLDHFVRGSTGRRGRLGAGRVRRDVVGAFEGAI